VVGARFSRSSGDTAPLRRVGPDGLPASPQAGPPPASAAGGPGRAVKGAGLVAIAVVSGLLWYLIVHTDPPPVADQQPSPTAGYDFVLAEGPVVATDCVAKSYGKTKQFFDDTNCKRLSRAIYTGKSDGRPVLVSVVLVTMPDAAKADQLKTLTDTDGTGNVTDLVKDGTYKTKGGLKLSDEAGQYQSSVSGDSITIVLAKFLDQHPDKVALAKVTAAALHLSSALRP
jgi:hypothetical protein